jgi:hypothetical protein
MSKMLFKGHQEPIQKMFNLFLREGHSVDKKSSNPPLTPNASVKQNRFPVEEERNKKLLQRDVIEVLMSYEEELKRIFTIYDHDNQKQKFMVRVFFLFDVSKDAHLGGDFAAEQENDDVQLFEVLEGIRDYSGAAEY